MRLDSAPRVRSQKRVKTVLLPKASEWIEMDMPGIDRHPSPFIRWAGGKRRLAPVIAALMPADFSRYIEPMIGAASVFFAVHPRSAILSDANEEVMNFYAVLRDQSEELLSRLERLSASEELYYQFRRTIPKSPMGRAVRFLYLNRLCWNGIYRVNKQGHFNVPFGSRMPEELWNLDNLRLASSYLSYAELQVGDFEDCVDAASEGDFVFFDPPYPKGASQGNGFHMYTRSGFSYEDHVRLSNRARELKSRGVYVLVTETTVPSILDLFKGEFTIHLVPGKSLIAASGKDRKHIQEAIILGY